MKKIIYFLIVILAAVSCDKSGMNEVWGGSERMSNRPGEVYMRQIAENLLVDNLKELENAIYLDSIGRASDRIYSKTGASIQTVGSKWILKDDDLEGLEISMVADSTWQLKRNAKYEFENDRDDESDFRTDYTITAKQHRDTIGRSRGHCAWRITVNGTRYEDMGYKAQFSTQPDFLFCGGKRGYWTSCRGLLQMEVTKNDKPVDRCTIEYFGRKNDYVYLRGF